MFYPVRSPFLFRWWYHEALWRMPAAGKKVYLTFDDGPHPTITPFVLEQLALYQAPAVFFCIGDNVQRYPLTYQLIRERGHKTGNHTQHHVNGWHTTTEKYIGEIREAAACIDSNYFRPPYGRITKAQLRTLKAGLPALQVIMWDVLSGDFDQSIDADQCISNVMRHVRAGSIIVFHDSEKAFPRLEKALPEILKKLKEAGFEFALL